MVKQGYKQTEIGVIPEDWEVINLEKNYTLKARIGWQGLTTAEYLESGDYCLITGTDFKNGYIDWDNCVYVAKERFDQDRNIQIKENDVLITKDGTIGKIAFIDKISNPTTLNSGVFVARPKNATINNRFFYYVLMSFYFDDFLSKITAGSTITHLYQKDFVHFNFILPPLAEQEAIAEALSDADAWIESLEQLIAKKRLIKQGAMQELLTPPSTSSGNADGEALEPWEVKKLGEVCDYKNGKSLESKISDTGVFNIISLNSIDIRGKLKKDHHKTNFNDNSLKKGDIVMVLSDVAHGNFLGLCDIIPDDNYVLNQRMGGLFNFRNIHVPFLRLQINYNQKYFKFSGKGSSQLNLGKPDILNFDLHFPSLSEQTRIATILSDMDAELEALEQKLSKARQIKQGMMQELLTGRTRLV